MFLTEIRSAPLGKLPQKSGGFTIIEILMAVVIVIILAAVAVPQYTATIQSQQTKSEITNLLNDINFARSEAIKEGQIVALCISTNGTSCTGTTWQSGWIVYSAGTSTAFTAGTSVVLRVQQPFTSTDTITTTPASTSTVAFNRHGFSAGFTATSGLLFTLHTGVANTDATRCLWIDVLGRSYVQKAGAALSSNGQTTACS